MLREDPDATFAFFDRAAGEEGSPFEEIKSTPPAAGGGGEEGGAGEVEASEGAGGGSGGVRRLRWYKVLAYDADEGRWVEGAVAAEELVVGDDAAEGGSGRGGAGEVGGRGKTEEDFLEELVRDLKERRFRRCSWVWVGGWRRRHRGGRAGGEPERGCSHFGGFEICPFWKQLCWKFDCQDLITGNVDQLSADLMRRVFCLFLGSHHCDPMYLIFPFKIYDHSVAWFIWFQMCYIVPT